MVNLDRRRGKIALEASRPIFRPATSVFNGTLRKTKEKKGEKKGETAKKNGTKRKDEKKR